MKDGREPVCILPPGCSTEEIGNVITALGAACPGHDLHIGNQTDGSVAIFYNADLEQEAKLRSNDRIVEERDEPNMELRVGFEQENGEEGEYRYASGESDEAILGLASFMLPVLESWDAANYVTTTILNGDDLYSFTIQRHREGGVTPAQKIARLEARLAEAGIEP